MAHIKMPWLIFIHVLLIPIKTSAKIPAIIIFGDSTVDTGNNNYISTIAQSNFEPYGRDFPGGRPTGRFCNGRILSDFISESFGLKDTVPAYLDPNSSLKDFATGVCFASSGTGYDNVTSDITSVIPLWKELEYYKDYQKKLRRYLGFKKANEILSEALYFMSLGTNDFMLNYYLLPIRSAQFTIKEYTNFLIGIARNFFTNIYDLGARKISLSGVIPLGCLPLERTRNLLVGNEGSCVEEYNKASMNFNKKLLKLVNELKKELPGIKMVFSDQYEIVKEIIQRPSSFGFEEVDVACCGTGRFELSYLCNRLSPFTCSDANKYVFWDSFHTTEKTDRLISDYLMNNSLYQFL